VESVGHESEIWVEESHHVGDLEFELVSWVEEELNPSKENKQMSIKMVSLQIKL
jgi:hypothetical protein